MKEFTAAAIALVNRSHAKVVTLAIVASLFANFLIVPSANASSHREAPFISEDPAADNTPTSSTMTC
ncbi:MAG: DUF4331 domain-containing protein [Acidobacteria bacterium]|nr:DUF4331 domain-containing protein [Acidobacteriota bacterium]